MFSRSGFSVATIAALVPLLMLFGCEVQDTPPDLPTNVIVISIDTLRADALGSYGSPIATPVIDPLAREGVLFETAIASAPETAASHATLFSGLDVQHHG